jgi:hypothetical protein
MPKQRSAAAIAINHVEPPRARFGRAKECASVSDGVKAERYGEEQDERGAGDEWRIDHQ